MARTSSSPERNGFSRRAVVSAALLAGTLLVALAGCGNDHPASSGGSMTVDIRGLKEQMGSGFSTQAVGQDGTLATTAVQSLVIGAVVITFTDTALTSDTNISSDTADKLADDLINSINFFTIVDLPTSEDFVEFKVPPPGASHWQVAAVGTKSQIVTFEDLNDKNVAIYYGFDGEFHTTSGATEPDVSIEMKRACFIDEPPRGCAAYGDNGLPVVTATVRILDVLDKVSSAAGNGTRVTGPTFPISVTDSTLAPAAAAELKKFVPSAGHTVTVVTTHPDAPGQSSCSSLAYATGVTPLTDPCIGTFVTRY